MSGGGAALKVHAGNNERAIKKKISNVIWIILCSTMVLTLLFLCKSRMQNPSYIEGVISITGDTVEVAPNVECYFIGLNGEKCNVDVYSETCKDGLKFWNDGSMVGYTYTYKFTLYNDKITVRPVIYFESRDTEMVETWNLKFDIHESNNSWDASVSSSDGNGSIVELNDIEKNGLEVSYSSEGSRLYRY